MGGQCVIGASHLESLVPCSNGPEGPSGSATLDLAVVRSIDETIFQFAVCGGICLERDALGRQQRTAPSNRRITPAKTDTGLACRA